MAGKKLANNMRLYVKAASPATTFAEVLGQGNLTINRQAGSIDLTSKSDAPYGLSAPGLRTVTIGCACIPVLPDATGYGRVETLSKDAATPAEEYKILEAPYDPDDNIVWHASMYTNISSTNLNMNEGVGVQIDLSLAAAPIVDTLTPVAA